MANQITPATFSSLPEDAFIEIFQHLNGLELGRCCLVNKQFHALANNDSLWTRFCGISRNERTGIVSGEKGTKDLEDKIIYLIRTTPLRGSVVHIKAVFPEAPGAHISYWISDGIYSQGPTDSGYQFDPSKVVERTMFVFGITIEDSKVIFPKLEGLSESCDSRSQAHFGMPKNNLLLKDRFYCGTSQGVQNWPVTRVCDAANQQLAELNSRDRGYARAAAVAVAGVAIQAVLTFLG